VRVGIRTKQIAGVTAIVGVAVVLLSAFYVSRLSRVVLDENKARGELLVNAILHRAREVAPASADPYSALRVDPGLRAVLESSIYGKGVIYAAIIDPRGLVIAANDNAMLGNVMPEHADLVALVASDALQQLRVIYSRDGQTLDLKQPIKLGDETFGSIRIGVSTLLMRRELNDSLGSTLLLGAAALIIAVFVAAFLAQLLLRPIHVIRSGLTRLGRGEFGVTLDLPPGDEFGELGSFFNTVSQQLSADRTLLAGQKANLQSAVEHLEDAVALFNQSGELLFSNPAMQPTLPADAIGRALQALLPTGHSYRTLVEETLATRTSRGPVQEGERLLLTHAISGVNGELVGVLLVDRNMAYLSRMQSTLAYSRKLVALGRLTAGIAHEVKNPLNAMMIHLELLRTKIRNAAREPVALAAGVGGGSAVVATETARGGAKVDALQHVEIIENEIRRLDEVVQGFLKFTRPEDLRLQPVDMQGVFDEIMPVLRPEAEANSVRVTVECSPLVRVNGDAGMLRQAFLNLAMNACQAMPTGGSLRLSCAPGSRDRVEVRVEDTGVGIPPEHLGKIFDLYFTTRDHGTGIGLSMVYRIIQLHDGEIEVQSTPGRGTTFKVLLPKANE
jgi:signal transduction histidine kinase/HAMP domain-containing protein